MVDGTVWVRLHHAVEALDEFLVRREARRLAGGLGPEAEARVEQDRERGHYPLPYRFHGGERLRDRPRDRLQRAEHRSVPPRRDLDPKPDPVPPAAGGARSQPAGAPPAA